MLDCQWLPPMASVPRTINISMALITAKTCVSGTYAKLNVYLDASNSQYLETQHCFARQEVVWISGGPSGRSLESQGRQSMLGKERGLQTIQAEQVPPVNILLMQSNESEAIWAIASAVLSLAQLGSWAKRKPRGGEKEAKKV